MDGGELAERLRDLDSKVPVLMSAPLTGAPAELLEGCRDLPFLAKPFTFFELNSAATSIGRSRACFARSTAASRTGSGRRTMRTWTGGCAAIPVGSGC